MITDTRRDWADGLRQHFSGVLLTPRDGDYDEVRRLHNGLIDKRPAIIASDTPCIGCPPTLHRQ